MLTIRKLIKLDVKVLDYVNFQGEKASAESVGEFKEIDSSEKMLNIAGRSAFRTSVASARSASAVAPTGKYVTDDDYG